MVKQIKNFFGTDGIRGRVGEVPITADFLLQLGWAVGFELTKQGGKKVVIGKDTRLSGYMIESALEAGLAAAGIESNLVGPLPTPAIAHLTHALRADLGIVISASHNHFQDNGIKFFTADGFKMPKEMEKIIEARFHSPMITVSAEKMGRAKRINDVLGRYIEFCKSSLPHRTHLRNIKIVMDCANGAAYQAAPLVFNELGAEVLVINNVPNGLNINDNCGSNHPEILSRHVLEAKADIGIALDGDGDRVIMVDHMGDILTGDELLYIITKGLIGTRLFSGGLVGTVMSNRGLELAAHDLGLAFVRVPVGDQNIIEELRQRQWSLGGEPSGHIIYLHVNTSADGIIAALQVLQSLLIKNQTLKEARRGITIFPQKITNINLIEKNIDLESEHIKEAILLTKKKLGEKGRLVVRKSGTEPLLRIMVESEDKEITEKLSDELCQVIKEE